jgi:NADPH-dependent 2,4-dienoyl-CoA reductase/sulfur reductase-like enzyme
VACLQNPVSGKEREYDNPAPASKPKKVAIVGAGPAGLEAALVSAGRGHEVTVYEKEKRPGGQFNLASLSKGKGIFRSFTIDWRRKQCEKEGVIFKFNESIDVKKAKTLLKNNDVLVIATGARWETPKLPGGRAKNISSNVDVLLGKAKIEGKKVAVGVDGPSFGASSRDAAEAAEVLAQKGHEVTIVGELPYPGPALGELNFFNSQLLRGDLSKLGVKNIPGARITGASKEGAEIIYNDGRKEIIDVDHIVLAWGVVPNREIADTLTEDVPEGKEVHVIGDCLSPRNAYRAIQDGNRVGSTI